MNRLPIRPALICLFTLCAMVSVGLFACSGPDNGAAPPPARTAHLEGVKGPGTPASGPAKGRTF